MNAVRGGGGPSFTDGMSPVGGSSGTPGGGTASIPGAPVVSGGGVVLGASLNIPNSSMLGRDGSSSVVFVLRAGRAARNSTTVDIAYGVGAGKSVKVGPVAVNGLIVPVHQTHSINLGSWGHQMFTGSTLEFSADVFAGQLGVVLGGSIGGLSENLETEFVNTFAFGGNVGSATLVFGYDGRSADAVGSIGKELYAIVGGGASVNFSISEYIRQRNAGRR